MKYDFLFKKFLYFQLLKSGHHRLVLRDVDLNSSGTYSCQITLSGPPFHTEQRDRNLSVISKYIKLRVPTKMPGMKVDLLCSLYSNKI